MNPRPTLLDTIAVGRGFSAPGGGRKRDRSRGEPAPTTGTARWRTQYRKLVPGTMLRHQVKPGITSWAQVSSWRGETDTVDKMQKRVECDLHTIRNWSLWLDVKIVALTGVRGFAGEGAY